jgi:hypothetical protein
MADKGRRKSGFDDYDVADFEEEPEPEPEPERELSPTLEEESTDLVEERRYFVDPQWYEERGLVFSSVMQARLCASCSSKLGTFEEVRYPVVDPKTKRVTFEMRKVPFGVNPLPTIRDHCSRERDYVTAETPLLEAIFRVFLANGNQPMTMAAVREHLLTFLPEMAALRSDYPVELLERLVRGDVAYGMREHKLPVAV